METLHRSLLVLSIFIASTSYGLPPSPGEDAPASLAVVPAPTFMTSSPNVEEVIIDPRPTRSSDVQFSFHDLIPLQEENYVPNQIVTLTQEAQKKIDIPASSSSPSFSRITVKRYKNEPYSLATQKNSQQILPNKTLLKRIHQTVAEDAPGQDGITYQYVYGYPHQALLGHHQHSDYSTAPETTTPTKPGIQYIYKTAIDHHAGSAVSSIHQPEHEYASKYQFGYQIRDPKTAAFFGHAEARDVHLTKGHYHVLLPDGRLQKVDYYADKSGFHAQVSYNGAAKHPETSLHHQ